jgi:hypothetical protein
LLIEFPCYPTTASGVVPTGFRHSYWSRDIAGESTAPQVRAMILAATITIQIWFLVIRSPLVLDFFLVFSFSFICFDFPLPFCWFLPSLHQ